jgi:hypothetical protein
MSKLLDLLVAPRTLLRQQQEIGRLHRELDKLRAQNESMRQGMRRCTTCDYRLAFREHQTI